jgi:acyl carrier protein
MIVRSTIITHIQEIASQSGKEAPPLTEELALLDSGLDSLGLAILVARLEETLGFDPFIESSEVSYPVTLGDFIALYERTAQAHGLDFRNAD